MKEIRRRLLKAGLNPRYLGYEYIAEGIEMIQKTGRPVQMKVLYRELAERFSTNEKCVERDIRTAFDILWKSGAFDGIAEDAWSERRPGNAKILHFLAAYWEK